MSEIIEVGMGELKVGQAPQILTTGGVGSCIVVCFYSAANRTGSMAHIMLPSRKINTDIIDPNQYRYADVAIEVMLKKLDEMGIKKSSLVGKITGGANMFPDVHGRSQKVGARNIESVKNILEEDKINIASENIGGTSGRSVSFDLGNGLVTITSNI